MGLFRRLGRQVEQFRRTVEATARDPSITRCDVCGGWMPAGSDCCLECFHQPPHAVLGVSPDASEAAVRAAARDAFKRTHPDQGGSRAEFRRVKRARERLLE